MIQQSYLWVCMVKRTENGVLKRHLHTRFIGTLLTIAKIWKQPKCPLTDEWIKIMRFIHVMEHFSVLKRKEILSHATT